VWGHLTPGKRLAPALYTPSWGADIEYQANPVPLLDDVQCPVRATRERELERSGAFKLSQETVAPRRFLLKC